jgi:hypothetical protein
MGDYPKASAHASAAVLALGPAASAPIRCPLPLAEAGSMGPIPLCNNRPQTAAAAVSDTDPGRHVATIFPGQMIRGYCYTAVASRWARGRRFANRRPAVSVRCWADEPSDGACDVCMTPS